jgi:hypothetical protein
LTLIDQIDIRRLAALFAADFFNLAGAQIVQMKYFRDDINALRAIAIVSVLCFRLHLANFIGGFGGVDMFFVVSRFLMTSIIWRQLESDKFSLRGFYAARAIRIIPMPLFLCSALLVFGSFWLDPLSITELGKKSQSSIRLLHCCDRINHSKPFIIREGRGISAPRARDLSLKMPRNGYWARRNLSAASMV